MQLQIALIGHGSWGRNHARVLRSLGALHTVYDDNPLALQDVPEAVDSLDRIWNDPEIQGVVIATPPATHHITAMSAMQAGKHVLVEKPLAVSSIQAYELERQASITGRILLPGHLMRYHEGFQKLLSLRANVGRLEYLYSHRLQPGRVRSDVSCLWSLAPHDISMMIEVAGVPRKVSCSHGVNRAGLADIVTATFEFNDGVRGHLFVSWLHPEKTREFTIIGDRGALSMDQESSWEPLRAELVNFIEAIEGKAKPLVTLTEGVDVVRVLEACESSMVGGKG